MKKTKFQQAQSGFFSSLRFCVKILSMIKTISILFCITYFQGFFLPSTAFCSNELFGHFPVVNQWSENWIEFFFQTPEDSPMETCLAILLAGMSQVEELLEENRAKKSITASMSANSRATPALLRRLFRPSNKIQWRGRSLVNPASAIEGFIYRYSWGNYSNSALKVEKWFNNKSVHVNVFLKFFEQEGSKRLRSVKNVDFSFLGGK